MASNSVFNEKEIGRGNLKNQPLFFTGFWITRPVLKTKHENCLRWTTEASKIFCPNDEVTMMQLFGSRSFSNTAIFTDKAHALPNSSLSA